MYEVPKAVRKEDGGRQGLGGEGNGGFLSNGYRLSIWKDGNVLWTNGG